jgi:DNA-binding MarR family transcriptional regulator
LLGAILDALVFRQSAVFLSVYPAPHLLSHNLSYIIYAIMNDQELARRIFGLYLPLVKCFRKAFTERSSISMGQFRVLALIEFESVRHVTKLAERNLVSQLAMSKTIDALVQAGHVARTESTQDRRLNELHVTSKGREAMSAVYRRAARELVPNLTRLSTQKRKQLAVALDIVTQALSRHPAKRRQPTFENLTSVTARRY